MKYVMLLLLLASCKRDLGERYYGLPDGVPSCSHDYVHPDRGTCVAAGKKYRCVWTDREDDSSRWTDVNCTTSWMW